MISIILATIAHQATDIYSSFIGTASEKPMQFILPVRYQAKSLKVHKDGLISTEFEAKPDFQSNDARWVLSWHFYNQKESRMTAVVAVWGDAKVKLESGEVLQKGVFFAGEFDKSEPLAFNVKGNQLSFKVPSKLITDAKLWIACSAYAPSMISREELPALDEVSRVFYTAPELRMRRIIVPSVPDF